MNRAEFLKSTGVNLGAIYLMNCLQSCKEVSVESDASEEKSFILDLTKQDYQALGKIGGFVSVSHQQAQVAGKSGSITNITKYFLVIHTQLNNFVAVNGNCTHQFNRLSYNSKSKIIECDLHGSNFEESGKIIKGPAVDDLSVFKTQYIKESNMLKVFI